MQEPFNHYGFLISVGFSIKFHLFRFPHVEHPVVVVIEPLKAISESKNIHANTKI